MTTRKVCIVGGGSAGWMAAAYLEAALRPNPRGTVEISLIESPNIPRISVGEATVPSIRHILSVIGLDQVEFMKAVDGSFKQSIKYVNWLHKDRHFYHHPFSRYRQLPIDRTGIDWLMSDRSIPFMETVSAQPQICDIGMAPLMLGKWDFGPPLTYAFHMNAQKFADHLRDIATARGVTHILDDVVEPVVGECGNIKAVKTKKGDSYEADIFVDCTGFASLLIEKTLNVGWEDCSQYLLNNRAVVMQVPYDHHYPGQVRPYTTATALSNGWVWDIPLMSYRSIGYVHSSDYISLEAAEEEIRAYEGPHSQSLSSRVINFKVGRREKAWVKNCISVGLSGGFIEPLESTGLYLSDLATVMLAEHFPFHDEDMDTMSFRVNRIMANRFYEIMDFINMHFCLTRRTDTDYWKEVQKPERIVPRLQAKFDYWKRKPPSMSDFEDQFFPGMPTAAIANPGGYAGDHRTAIDVAGLWNHESYECIMYGMDFMGDEYRQMLGNNRAPSRVANQIIQRLQTAPSKLPPHDIWLQRVLGMPNWGPRNDKWCSHGL
ncbi:tryptophan halogenase family protein [Kordiimonas pumila]|uniref:Tryptophan halogenase family protein n=1 Tax=Kordiimonas pumila TaxID=2161677 RepID=A0ABV7D546_9PROT|nr:tryptophan halogenase family protein [Kordiimonas pumila]